MTYGKSLGLIILTAQKMGYPISSFEKEQAILLNQNSEISPFNMGNIERVASRLKSQIINDKRAIEAQEEVKKINTR